MSRISGTCHSLTAGTLYHFRVKSRDASGNIAVSSDQTFTTTSITPTPTPTPTSGGGGGGYTPPTPTPTPTSTSTIPTVTPTPTPLVGGGDSASTVKLINNKGTIYLIQNGKRQGVTNPGLLNSYGFKLTDATPATSADLNVPAGSLLLPADGSLVKSKEDQTVYLISNQQRYSFTSAKVFTGLGFKFSSVLVVTNPELQALPKAANISNPSLAHLPGQNISLSNTIYWLGYDNKLHAYPDLNSYNSWNLSNDFSSVVPANSQDSSIPIGDMVSKRVKG